MPVDKGGRGTNAVYAKPKPAAVQSRPDEGTRGLVAKPQPNPVLQQQFNFHGSVEEFNRRLEVIDKSHQDSVGYKPSGALAFDIAKSPVKDEQIPVLFQGPRTKKAAVAASFVRANPAGVLRKQDPFSQTVARSAEFAPTPLTEDELVDGMAAAARKGKDALRAFRDEHRDEILASGDKYGAGQSPLDIRNAPKEVQAASVAPLNRVDKAFGIAMLGTSQVYTALLVGPPAIAVAEGKAVKATVQGDQWALVRTNVELAKAAVTGFYNDGKAVATGDWDYIAANPGFIALDIMGGAGTLGKLGRAGMGTRTLAKGGIEVKALRSENAGAALIQDAIRYRRQKAANLQHDTEEVVLESRLGHYAQKNLGFVRKVGRELERERRLEVSLGDMVRRDLERVTGWSERRAGVMRKVGFKAHRGLTRGEQMALFIESLDEPGTWADRAALLKKAHEGWLRDEIGSKQAHEQKLRDITLAEQAMKKPSPRYEKALSLTREAVAQMEELKLRELNLDPTTARGRVAGPAEVARTGKALEAPVEKLRDDSFYVPTVSALKSRPLAKQPFRGGRFSPYGMAEPNLNRLAPELTHQWTGRAMQAGDYRIDTTRLVGEAVGRTVRAASVISQYKTLLKGATDKRRSEFDRAIRVTDGIPDELRALVNKTDEGELAADEVGALSKHDADEMLRVLFPGQRTRGGEWIVDKEIEGVKWVDERLINPDAWTQPMPTAFTKGAAAVNSPFRFVTLYLRPAYILNLLGATGQALFYQGAFLPKNIARAVLSEKLYGSKVTNGLKELVGGGRVVSYVTDAPVSRASKHVAAFWNTITDERLRMSTAFYYGRKAGIKTREDWEAVLDGARTGDKKAFDTLNEITDRTKKAMVQFDNLTWAEQNLLKHAIFIYPWQRGAAVWSVRTLVERPVTSATLAQIGRDHVDDIDDFLGHAPEWVKAAGFLPLGYDANGNPRIVSPAGLNTFSTIGSLMHSRVDQLLGAGGELAVRAATEKDEFGNTYPSDSRLGRWRDAAVDVLGGVPQLTALKKSRAKEEVLPPVDVTDRGSLEKQVNDALALTVMSPGWGNGYGMLLTGASATPRAVNKLALTARWYREASFEDRQAFQKELMNRALKAQGQLLGKPVSMEVSRLVNFQFDIDAAVNEKQKELARDLTPMEQTLTELAFYKSKGLVGDTVDLEKQAARLSADEHDSFRRDLFSEFADPKGRLKEWDTSVRRVNALATPGIVNERLRRLSESGVNDASGRTALSREQLKGYAHKADAYALELTQRTLEIAELRKTDPDRVAAAEAELLAWKSEQDKPVSVQGRLLPSPARMEWAKDWKFDERKANVAVLASQSWGSLTKFEKELLGTKTSPAVVAGWKQLEELKAEYVASAPRGERSVPADFEKQAAKYINKGNDGFLRDWLYSQEPLAIRLQTMKPIVQSSNAAEWQRLFLEVRPAIQALKDGAPKSHLRDSWKDYVNQSMTFSPGFQAELDLYGIDPATDLF